MCHLNNNNDQGVTRVAELEAIAGEILDLWHRESLLPETGYEDEVSEVFERFQTCLATDELEFDPE